MTTAPSSPQTGLRTLYLSDDGTVHSLLPSPHHQPWAIFPVPTLSGSLCSCFIFLGRTSRLGHSGNSLGTYLPLPFEIPRLISVAQRGSWTMHAHQRILEAQTHYQGGEVYYTWRK